MKILVSYISILLIGVLHIQAQEKYISKTGHISFFSSAPLEDIEAHNHQVLSIIDFSSGEIAVSVLMKAFEFDKALMQEHFNENYVESSKYPKATFQGKMENYEQILLSSPTNYFVDVEGVLTIHGVSKKIKTKVKLVTGEQLSASGSFDIKIVDYGIAIPTVVVQNIAETVKVSFDLVHKKVKK